MTQASPPTDRTCIRCQAPMNATERRCPFCGTEQPPEGTNGQPPPFEPAKVGLTAANRASLRPAGQRPVALPRRIQLPSVMTILGGLVVVAVLAGLGWRYLGSSAPPPVASAPAPLPPLPTVLSSVSGLSVPDASRADPTALLPLIRRSVVGNEPDAQLVEIAVHQSRRGVVDLGKPPASIVYTYALPTPRDAPRPKGPAPVAGRAFELKRDEGGAREVTLKKEDQPVPEPNCVWSAAWRAAVSSGLPEDAAVEGVYRKLSGEPRWRISVEGQSDLVRELDGMSCAVKTR